MTGSLGITLRVLRNTGLGESTLKFIHNYLHFCEAKTIHIHNPNWKHKKKNNILGVQISFEGLTKDSVTSIKSHRTIL